MKDYTVPMVADKGTLKTYEKAFLQTLSTHDSVASMLNWIGARGNVKTGQFYNGLMRYTIEKNGFSVYRSEGNKKLIQLKIKQIK